MITISLCMIVKNEQDTLQRCLESVRDIADEIVIVDTGSTDQTKEIAGKFTPHVIDFEWIDDFAAARNFSFAQATMDYILWLDADDVLLPENRQKLLQLKQSLDPSVDAISMEYHCAFDDHGNVTLNVRRIRLVKRLKNYQWQGAVHEDLSVKGIIYDSDVVVTHKQMHDASDRNLKIYENLLRQGKEFTTRDLQHYARELHHHKMYEQAIEYYLKFMVLDDVTPEDKIFVCGKMADCYYHLGDRDKELEITLKSFDYDIPRPEFCCRLGYRFLEKVEFHQAAFWYKLAIETPPPKNQWAIVNHPSRTWLPHMQLGLCYYQLGEYELSYRHNSIALTYRPDDEQIQNNVKLLEELLQPVKAR
ncbi:glycosyltransferase family 2 protein [Paenibacillus filicis]|uniref:Glycosyltransferase family 2 protein n=1 Tax=Paenibacillus gyeongsangnamensis TaxID=3388067 RepID=A0ABT4QHR1_9BACL|nr:glycosyltransferase family 2 protein [Paenibacillus filicis]MCZ8516401.1 glycosyltransferase family 2 protein [Paenibacillus filicis]